MDTGFLTIPEVARLRCIGETSAYTLAREGKLPAFKPGNHWRWSRRSLPQWVDSGGIAQAPKAPTDEDGQP